MFVNNMRYHARRRLAGEGTYKYMIRKNKITVNYALCGEGSGVDPRECGICLRVCAPAVFHLHQSFNAKEEDLHDPQIWRVTPLWLSLCTRCMKCVESCPVGAISVR